MHQLKGRSVLVFAAAVVAFLALGATQSLAGQPTFTEAYNIPEQPCDGLNLDGVAYSFTIAGTSSPLCIAGTNNGSGTTNNISAPNILGFTAGVLTLTFDHPTTDFGFGVALATPIPQPTDVTVDLFRPGKGLLRQEVSLSATPDPLFVGGRFDYSGPAVLTATIHFDTAAAPAFVIDNVTYVRSSGAPGGDGPFTEAYNIAQQACDGLNLDGVAYSFTIAGTPSPDCQAGTSTGPGTTNNIVPPNIEGNAAGVLTLTFDHPTTEFSFGVALCCAFQAGVTVDLFRRGKGQVSQQLTLSATPDPFIPGGRFEYSGLPIQKVTIRFAANLIRFAIDNVTYLRSPGQPN